jgi:hypothetical protein
MNRIRYTEDEQRAIARCRADGGHFWATVEPGERNRCMSCPKIGIVFEAGAAR